MSDLVAFLLARIEEDERAARATPASGYHDPARVLAECEAKRRMLPYLVIPAHRLDHCDRCSVLRLLALPYADHGDYDLAWRP